MMTQSAFGVEESSQEGRTNGGRLSVYGAVNISLRRALCEHRITSSQVAHKRRVIDVESLPRILPTLRLDDPLDSKGAEKELLVGFQAGQVLVADTQVSPVSSGFGRNSQVAI